MPLYGVRQSWGHEQGAEMEQSIEAAFAHARLLRQRAKAADGYGARATEAEAERWERLASTAQDELRVLCRD